MSQAMTSFDHDMPLDNGWYAWVRSGLSDSSKTGGTPPGLTDQHWQSFCNQLIKNPSAINGYAPLKASKDGQVILATIMDNTRVVCKQSRVKGAFRRIIAMLRSSRERQQFNLAIKILACGISTAAPYALIHKRWACEGWLISQYLENSVDLDQAALYEFPRMRSSLQRKVKNGLIQRLAELISQMQQYHVYHGDFKASNILATNLGHDDRDGKVWLIDTEGIQFRSTSTAPDDRSLIRLIASLLAYRSVTLTDLVRLLIQLRPAADSSPNAWKQRLRELLQQAIAYNLRSRSRKSHKLDGYQ